MFNRIIFPLLFIVALCNAANFTSTHGKLKVSGGKILDKNNNEVVLRGMSLFWQQWDDGGYYYTSSVVSSLANNWNTSVVRAALTITNNGTQIAKNMMDWANAAGTYVIIDNHSHDAHNNAQSVQNFFKDVSAYVKEKGYTHVIYEIYNEPVSPTTWAQIKSFAGPVIDEIRKNDPDGLIIVGTPNYSGNISAPRNDPLTGTRAHNVLYALHFYAGDSGHSNYRESLKAAYCNNFPVFVSEWGTSPASGNGTISTSNSNTWISMLEAAKVSYANWSITDKDESSAALKKNNGQRGSVDRDADLTESGKYVKNLFKLNTGSTLANVGLTQTAIDCSVSTPTGPDGKIELGNSNLLTNFKEKNGADSLKASSGVWVLNNTSANFTADYTIVGIEEPGSYLISFRLGSTAGGTVSWSGSGVSSGNAQIINTGNRETYQYTESHIIEINEKPETPLHLSFQTPSANSLGALMVYVRAAADSADSVKYGITPVRSLVSGDGKHWNYNAAQKTFVFESKEGSLTVYSLRGERIFAAPATGRVSLKTLSPGAYLAVYRRNNQVQHQTIYLK